MKDKPALRALAAAAMAVAGVGVAVLLGAPPAAALLALIAGAAAYFLAPSPARDPAAVPEKAEDPAQGPAIADLLEAVEEPMLLVRNGRIDALNRAARNVLGDHVAGVDIRLAIRHPAATEMLVGPPAGEGMRQAELVGVGDADRQWRMIVAELPGADRLIRLTDLSQARAAEQMRVDFVANASHELRTPLSTLIGFLETLEDDATAEDRETRRRFLKIMTSEATRMRDLVEDLMSLSRIEAERYQAPRDRVDLRPLVDEVSRGLAQLAAGREAVIAVESEVGDASVVGDRAQLAQLLSNLAANALNYGPTGGTVRIRLEETDSLIRISVADRGEGIAPEHLPRLTERFYRVDPGRSRAVGGTGLGLAIAKHIVLRHRGRLDIKSRLGEGTTVSVDLPRSL